MSSFQLFIISASIVTIILAIYAVYLGLKLRLRQRRQSNIDLSDVLSKSQVDAKQAIKIIALSLLQNDLTSTEAAMRIAFLAKQIIPSADEAQQIRVFEKLAAETAHIPILEPWQALPAKDKKKFDQERRGCEQQYAEAIQAAAQYLSKIEPALSAF